MTFEEVEKYCSGLELEIATRIKAFWQHLTETHDVTPKSEMHPPVNPLVAQATAPTVEETTDDEPSNG